ncbi:MAG: hypothetical protein IJD37_06940 [Clostridia bacterium]|nr:hypothetical protein [Clostridia bacterium]
MPSKIKPFGKTNLQLMFDSVLSVYLEMKKAGRRKTVKYSIISTHVQILLKITPLSIPALDKNADIALLQWGVSCDKAI